MNDSDSDADLNVEVIVIVGGSAGSAAATMVARKGWQVTVLEWDRSSRENVGESLLPASTRCWKSLERCPPWNPKAP